MDNNLSGNIGPDTRLVQLASWEVNGYDDSDGFTLYYHVNEDRLVTVLSWSTRFAGRASQWEPTLEPITDHWDAVKKHWVECLTDGILQADEIERTEVDGQCIVGQQVKMACTTKRMVRHRVQCDKCEDGYWKGKKEYPCFSCNGRGFLLRSHDRKRDTVAQGTEAKVIGYQFDEYKHSHARRYGQHCPADCIIETEDGKIFTVEAVCVELARPALTREQAFEQATERWNTCENRGDVLARLKGMRAWSDWSFR